MEGDIFNGIWTIPNTSVKNIPGRATVKNDHIELQLTFEAKNSISDSVQESIFFDDDCGYAIGELDSGTTIILEGVLFRPEGSSMTKDVEAVFFRYDIAYIGYGVKKDANDNKVLFNKLHIGMSNLDLCFKSRSLDVTVTETKYLFDFKPKKKKRIVLADIDGFTICYDTEMRLDYSSDIESRNLSIKRKHIIVIESENSRNLEEFNKIVVLLKHFFSLILLEQVDVTFLETFQAGNNYRVKIISHKDINSNISYQRRIIFRQFPLDVFKTKLNKILNNFKAKYESLDPFFNLFFSQIYSNNQSNQNQFLIYLQALEAYHRRTRKNLELPTTSHEKRINAILSSIPNKYKEWLSKRLLYSNEKNFRIRLCELYSDYDKSNSTEKADRSRTINRMVSLRNYYVHYDKDTKVNIPNEREFQNIISELLNMICYFIFKEIGFTRKDLEKVRLHAGYISPRKRRY